MNEIDEMSVWFKIFEMEMDGISWIEMDEMS